MRQITGELTNHQILERFDEARVLGPRRVFGGPVEGSMPGERAGVNTDREFLAKVAHVLLEKETGKESWGWWDGIRKLFREKRRESAIEFVARTGLGPAQAMTMTREQITAFVAQAMENRKDDVQAPRSTWKPEPPKPGPSVIDTGAPEPEQPAEPVPNWI